jgi:hypothetical protein
MSRSEEATVQSPKKAVFGVGESVGLAETLGRKIVTTFFLNFISILIVLRFVSC